MEKIRWLSNKQTRERYADRSATWLWRTSKNDPDFPKPIRINGIPYRSAAELDAYDEKKRGRP